MIRYNTLNSGNRFVIYCDFETLNTKHTCYPDLSKSSTTPTTKCEPCGYGYKVVCVDSRYTKPTVIFRGQHASKHFFKALLSERAYIKDVLSRIEPLNMTEMDELSFKSTTKCHICDQLFTDEIVKERDHCHVSGKFRGASCQSCNLNFKHPRFIPIICHGLTNFDSHIICSPIGLFKKENISCIAKSTEKYISFSLGDFRFIDSYQCLSAPLESLVEFCAKDGGLKNFELLKRETDKPHLLLRKGVYLYDYMDTFDRFDETILPTHKQFYNRLSKSHISHDDYE